MNKVDYGAYIKLCYTGTLKNGVVFDKTDKCKPVAIQVGDGSLVQGFENALIGMGRSERRSFVLRPEEAYGYRDEKLERTYYRESLELGFEPCPAQVILFMTRDGREFPAVIKFVNDEIIVVDFNHPLAGRNLSFDVEVASINETPNDSQSECAAECCCA